jgi:hypothetical protein
MHATVTRLSFQRDQGVEAAEAALRRVIDGLPATHSEAEADAASASVRPMIAAAVGRLSPARRPGARAASSSARASPTPTTTRSCAR